MSRKILLSIHQTVQVIYNYPVHFTEHLFACENPLLQDVIGSIGDMETPKKILCVVDRGVWQHHPRLLDATLLVLSVPQVADVPCLPAPAHEWWGTC